jgi:hypothetical protein
MWYFIAMPWAVENKASVDKALKKLPQWVGTILATLAAEMALNGPVRGNWPNYSKLGSNRHHCHLRKGRPTYVAVWQEKGNTIQCIEVIYVGTHEKAPY